MEKIVRPQFQILDFKFPAFFVIIVSLIMRLIKAELSTAAVAAGGTKRETPDAGLPGPSGTRLVTLAAAVSDENHVRACATIIVDSADS